MRASVWLLLATSCGRVGFVPLAADDDAAVIIPDAPPDARTFCFGPPFAAAQLLVEASTPTGGETYPDISADGLSIYVTSDGFPGQIGNGDIFLLTRPTTSATFGPAVVVPISSADWDTGPSLSADGLTLYYSPFLGDGLQRDVWVSTRASLADSFTSGTRIAALSAPGEDRDPDISPDGLTLYFDSDRVGTIGSTDIWMSTRPDLASPFGAPTRVAELSSMQTDRDPNISGDGLVLYFASNRPGGVGSQDIWMSRRPTTTSPWGTPTNVTEASTTASEGSPSVSDDGMLIWDTTLTSDYDTYYTTPSACP